MKVLLSLLLLFSTCFAQESRIKIAVIDTGINEDSYLSPYLCSSGHKDFTNTSLKDANGHGTLVTSLIVNTLDHNKYCVIIYKWTDSNSYVGSSAILKALKYALQENVSYVNMSLSGELTDPIEKALLIKLLNKEVIITVAAGNNSLDLSKDCSAFPACYFKNRKNFYVVANYNRFNKPQDHSNYGGSVNAWEDGHNRCYYNKCSSGTSLASPIKLNRIIHEKE